METTSVFRADFLNELDAPTQSGTESSVSGVEGLPAGSALLVVKRGPTPGRASCSINPSPRLVGIPTATSSSMT
ncbi:oxoglutarate dehydrogenase inhibitor [Mycobacterium ulcerans str. Harvey]|uniref:Oxoglutarate dehydrogenase inhibitor n=1 Tax=Mycobacterium ulcerans str. Harvey TaxID=1299332 RepID=A0ABP3AFJ2_MYCUL|nr:oxoglutarate dehydrogenase inhibitor [Mycobacterium ulcerans str. Harvey]